MVPRKEITGIHPKLNLRLHLTNVTGAGASHVVESLLRAMESDSTILLEKIYLPIKGNLKEYRVFNVNTEKNYYSRILPNNISRLLECTFFSYKFDGSSVLVVLGDLPLRCKGPQILFIQQALLFGNDKQFFSLGRLKNWFSRYIFKANQNRVSAFIVQTNLMKKNIESALPEAVGRVFVVSQPAPSWIIGSGLKRYGRILVTERLNLFYPAMSYAHKNHKLLSKIVDADKWPVDKLVLTIDPKSNPAPYTAWIKCMGSLSTDDVLAEYSTTDALLFLSQDESYGLPLIEAMFIGLPIVCPDLPYAHEICSNEAIYFKANDPISLLQALTILEARLRDGWWPNWKSRLESIPSDWNQVSSSFSEIIKSLDAGDFGKK